MSTDKTPAPGDNSDDSTMTSDDTPEVAYYECPHCGLCDSSEADVRLHVTQTDDHKHRGRNGFDASENVIVVGTDGEELDVRSGDTAQLAEVDGGELRTELLPKDAATDDTEQLILMTALMNPRDSVSELHRKVNRNSEDSEVIPYHKVRNLVNDTVGTRDRPDGRTATTKPEPEPEPDAEATPARESLFEGFSELQQRVLKAYARDPIRSFGAIANEADCSNNYVPMTLKEGGEQVVVSKWNAPTVDESRLMYLTEHAEKAGRDPTDPNALKMGGGGQFNYEWPTDPSYNDLPFHQQAVVDHLLANADNPTNPTTDDYEAAADDMAYPTAYVHVVTDRHAELIETLRDEAKAGNRQIRVERGNSRYSGAAKGLDLTYSTHEDRAKTHRAHLRRMNDLETLPDEQTPTDDSDETPGDYPPEIRRLLAAVKNAHPPDAEFDRKAIVVCACGKVCNGAAGLGGHSSFCGVARDLPGDANYVYAPDEEPGTEIGLPPLETFTDTDASDAPETLTVPTKAQTEDTDDSEDDEFLEELLDDTDDSDDTEDTAEDSDGDYEKREELLALLSAERRRHQEDQAADKPTERSAVPTTPPAARTQVARLRDMAERGAERGDAYAAGQLDALETVLEILDTEAEQ